MESSVLGVASSGRKRYKTIALLIPAKQLLALHPGRFTHTEKTFCLHMCKLAWICIYLYIIRRATSHIHNMAGITLAICTHT